MKKKINKKKLKTKRSVKNTNINSNDFGSVVVVKAGRIGVSLAALVAMSQESTAAY